jgi:ribonuclease HI
MSTNRKYVLYFDGGSTGNPGPSGSGSVLYEDDVEIWADSHYVGDMETNNTAEYTGLIRGLKEAVERNIDKLVVKGDSLLIIKQMRGEYRARTEHIKALNAYAKEIEAHFHEVKYFHVPRTLNKRADELSRIRVAPI